MNRDELVAWFESVHQEGQKLFPTQYGSGQSSAYPVYNFFAWLVLAENALFSVFGRLHPVAQTWRSAKEASPKTDDGAAVEGGPLLGAFEAVCNIVRSGRIRSLLDAARVEAESDLLTQAHELLDGGYLAAAAVIAGGALELHLMRLCQQHGLVIGSDGNIGKYDGAIAKARNEGQAVIYSAADTTRVKLWGKLRNDAAHNPASFTTSENPDTVRRMIEDIATFIERSS